MLIDESLPGFIHPKTTLEKLLVLVRLLQYKRTKTYAELASILNKSERQVRRDIKMLERFFQLEYDFYGRPFILTEVNEDELMVNLTTEEMAFLSTLVRKSKSKFKDGLMKKLDLELHLEFDEDSELAKKIDHLEVAISAKNKVILKNYASAHSKSVRDIEVEPIMITEFKYLTAFDVTDKKVKVFAIDRITGVETTQMPFGYQELHLHLKPDPFGMASGQAHLVDLLLSERAYLLMREEYPRTRLQITKSDSPDYPWRFYSTVYGLEGIGRFVLGLLGEIEIVTPQELKNYLKDRISQFQFNK